MTWQRPDQRPWVLGHRGARTAPENTVLAFEHALLAGADGVEFDVRLSADAQVVVAHDATLARITQRRVTAAVDELTLAQLREVELGQAAKLASLEEVLTWAAAKSCRLNIELKTEAASSTGLVEAVVRTLRSNSLEHSPLLSSFDIEVVRQLAPHFDAVAWLVDDDDAFALADRALREAGATALNPHQRLLTPRSVRRLKDQGFLVHTWTVNNPERAHELSALGVDSIITDEPRSIVRRLCG
jgi:glycerophosphoryl diester phosphodiesterase